MTYTIKASTPEAMRDEIVKWLKMNASNNRIAAAKLTGIHKIELVNVKANAYQQAADFIEHIVIEN